MKKVLVVLALSILIISFVLAQQNGSNGSIINPPGSTSSAPSDNVDKAYQCLSDLIDEKDEGDLSLQEAVFSTLALGSKSKLKSVIENAEENDCWPSGDCTIKETAQVLLAYDRIHSNTQDVEEWLLDKTETAAELAWYLQIDISNHLSSSCTLSYDNSDYTINIGEDMKIVEGSAGSCLSRSSSGFWLRVNNDCIEKTFRTSCDQDFITNLLYQRQGSSTVYVSSETHSQAALGTTEEKINSKCLRIGATCDYEGTLWAALALDRTDNEIKAYLPYLLALSPENQRFFPNTFLYLLTQGNDQYSEIIQAQQQGKYWQAPNTPYNRFYDTSLAMLSLQGTSSQELANAKNYLLGIQTPEGCWNNNNIRDTGFILYSGWSRSVSTGGTGTGQESCISLGHYCTSGPIACADAGGVTFPGLDCELSLNVCCSVPSVPPSCSAQNGLICDASQTCTGTTVSSIEGSCCLGSCQELPQANDCEVAGGGCFNSCLDNEEQITESCGSGLDLLCCKAKQDAGGTGGSVWVWIILFVILIALVILGIIYRRKLQLMFFKLRNKRRGSGRPAAGPGRRPPYPPYGPSAMRRPMPLGTRPSPRTVPLRQTSSGSKTDKELEETLRKLKEMSN